MTTTTTTTDKTWISGHVNIFAKLVPTYQPKACTYQRRSSGPNLGFDGAVLVVFLHTFWHSHEFVITNNFNLSETTTTTVKRSIRNVYQQFVARQPPRRIFPSSTTTTLSFQSPRASERKGGKAFLKHLRAWRYHIVGRIFQMCVWWWWWCWWRRQS